MWRMLQTVLLMFIFGVPTLVTSPVLFSSLCHKSPPVAICGSASLPASRMGLILTPTRVNGSVETDCRQAFAVDHWSRLIRKTPSWAAGSRERPVKGAHCIIITRQIARRCPLKAGLSQTLVFNNWPLVMPQRRYTDLVTDVCVLESFKANVQKGWFCLYNDSRCLSLSTQFFCFM